MSMPTPMPHASSTRRPQQQQSERQHQQAARPAEAASSHRQTSSEQQASTSCSTLNSPGVHCYPSCIERVPNSINSTVDGSLAFGFWRLAPALALTLILTLLRAPAPATTAKVDYQSAGPATSTTPTATPGPYTLQRPLLLLPRHYSLLPLPFCPPSYSLSSSSSSATACNLRPAVRSASCHPPTCYSRSSSP